MKLSSNHLLCIHIDSLSRSIRFPDSFLSRQSIRAVYFVLFILHPAVTLCVNEW